MTPLPSSSLLAGFKPLLRVQCPPPGSQDDLWEGRFTTGASCEEVKQSKREVARSGCDQEAGTSEEI